MDIGSVSGDNILSSVESEVQVNLESIFPDHGPDKIKRCISSFKDRHKFATNFSSIRMLQWCIDRLLDDNTAAGTSNIGSKSLDVTNNQSSTDVKKNGCEPLVDNNQPVSSPERFREINQSKISPVFGGNVVLEAETGLNRDKNIMSESNSCELVTKPNIGATGSNTGFMKSVSNSFDVSRNDMYTSTILDSSESDESTDSIPSVNHSPDSNDELPKISFQKIPRETQACLAAPKFTITSSASSCNSSAMSWRSSCSSKQTTPITSTVSTICSSFLCTSTLSSPISTNSASSSSQFSSFKLSPAKFSFSQTLPVAIASTANLMPASSVNLISSAAVSTASSIPVITNTSSTSRSPNHLQQTVTIKSTHQITYNPLMQKKPDENGFASGVKTKFTAPTPNITVQLSQPVNTLDRQQQPQPRPTLNYLAQQSTMKSEVTHKPKYVKCEGCKAYYDNEVITSHKTKCELFKTMQPKRFVGETSVDDHWNPYMLDQDMNRVAMLDHATLGKLGFQEGRVYSVCDNYGNGQRMECRNGNLVSLGHENAQVFGEHTFVEGRCYNVSSRPEESHLMVWSKGKLRPKSDSTLSSRKSATLDTYKQTHDAEYRKLVRSLLTYKESTNEIGPHQNAAEKTVPVARKPSSDSMSFTRSGTNNRINLDYSRNDPATVQTNKEIGPHLHEIVSLNDENETINLDDVETNNEPSIVDPMFDYNNVEIQMNDGGKQHTEDVIFIKNEAAPKNDLSSNNGATTSGGVDEVTKVRNEVLELFPDVEPNHLDSLCVLNTGPMAVNNICLQLLDSNYPKRSVSAAKPVSESQPVEKKASPVDYSTSRPEIPQQNKQRYNEQAFHKLAQEFLWIPANDIKFVLSISKYYALAHEMLQQIWSIPSEIVKKHSLSTKHGFRQLEFKCELEAHKGHKITRKIKLLKNRRPVIKLAADVFPELVWEIKFVEKKLKESAVEEDYKMACNMNEQEYETEGQSIECGCCYVECQFELMVQCYEGHLFCESCLSQYAREAVFGQGKADLKCMTGHCGSAFPLSQLQKALPPDVLSKYEDRVTEENINLADLGDLVQCPCCDFRACLDPNARVFTCQNPECRKETCRYCQVEWSEHFGKKCSEVEKQDETKLRLEYEEKMTKAKVRVCHRCKAQFTKEDGCNKMTCRCGAKQCYICRKPDIDYNHFCRHPRDPGKLCTTCKDCSLWTNPDEDDDRAVLEIQKEAGEERKKKGFTSDRVVGVPEEPPCKKKKTS